MVAKDGLFVTKSFGNKIYFIDQFAANQASRKVFIKDIFQFDDKTFAIKNVFAFPTNLKVFNGKLILSLNVFKVVISIYVYI